MMIEYILIIINLLFIFGIIIFLIWIDKNLNRVKCIICDEDLDSFDIEYASMEYHNKMICSGCGENIYVLFKKDFTNIELTDCEKARFDTIDDEGD